MRDADYLAHRDLVMRLAYDITGSWADAEDVAQTAYLRWHGTKDVQEARAYLARIAVNAALDLVQRRDYTGPTLPGPIPTGPGADAAVEQAQEVELALARVLQSLSPLERSVFLLHDVFAFTYAEIADMVGRTPAATRQLGHRARAHVEAGRPRFETSAGEVSRVAAEFFAAARQGDLDGLVRLLTEDVALTADGGGRVSSAMRPVVGADKVARFVLGLAQKGLADSTIDATELNGHPAWLLRGPDGVLDQVVWMQVRHGRIAALLVVRDPRKLTAVPG